MRGLLGWLVLVCLAAPARAELGEVRTEIGYVRGKRVKLQLVTVDWVEIEVKTARAFLAMRAAAARDGVALYVRSGFRDMERQRWLYQAWRAGWGNQAARPGYSNHQAGRALDLVVDEPGVLAWLTANARKFGFRRTVKKEPWHWEFRGRPRAKKR